MKKIAIGLIVVLALLIASAPAWGRGDNYSLNVGIPVSFSFSEDEQTQTTQPSKSPSGIQLLLGTPFNVAFGIASFESGFSDPDDLFWQERDIKYTFLEAVYMFTFDAGFFAIGAGVGSMELDPVSTTATVDFIGGTATEWILMLGFNLGDTWDIQAGFHAMTAEVDIEIGGVTFTSGDIGATLVTLGAGFQF